jgi:hypothetical protein
MMKLAEILSGPETWWQGNFHCPADASRMCLEAGFFHLTRIEAWDPAQLEHEYQRLERLMPKHLDLTRAAIPAWNDESTRTWEDVAAVVDAYDRDRLLNP